MKSMYNFKKYCFSFFLLVGILFLFILVGLVLAYFILFSNFTNYETFFASFGNFYVWIDYWITYFYYLFTLTFKLFIYNFWSWPDFTPGVSHDANFIVFYLREAWGYLASAIFNIWIFFIKPNYLAFSDYLTVHFFHFFHDFKRFFSSYFPSLYYVVDYVNRYWNGITKSLESVQRFIRLIKRKMRKAGWSWFYFYVGIFAAFNFLFFLFYIATIFFLFLFLKPMVWYFSYRARLSHHYLQIISKRLTPEQLQMFYASKNKFYFFKNFKGPRALKFLKLFFS